MMSVAMRIGDLTAIGNVLIASDFNETWHKLTGNEVPGSLQGVLAVEKWLMRGDNRIVDTYYEHAATEDVWNMLTMQWTECFWKYIQDWERINTMAAEDIADAVYNMDNVTQLWMFKFTRLVPAEVTVERYEAIIQSLGLLNERSGKDGGGPSTDRKARINQESSLFNTLQNMGQGELVKELQDTDRPKSKQATETQWCAYFDTLVAKVRAVMETLPEDRNVMKVSNKLAEMELSHGGCKASVAKGKCHSEEMSAKYA